MTRVTPCAASGRPATTASSSGRNATTRAGPGTTTRTTTGARAASACPDRAEHPRTDPPARVRDQRRLTGHPVLRISPPAQIPIQVSERLIPRLTGHQPHIMISDKRATRLR